MKICTFICLVITFLCSCATLTKTQLTTVNQFAKTSENFSAYPSKILEELADLRMRRGVFYANSLDDPKLHLGELDNIYDFKKEDLKISAKADITFKIIDKYAQSLVLLSSNKYSADVSTQAQAFGENIDSLITMYNQTGDTRKVPAGIGAGVSEWITAGGRIYIRTKQAREVKKFVLLADTMISVMCTNLTEYLNDTNLKDLIENESKNINSNYLSYLRQKSTVTNVRGPRDTLRLVSDTRSSMENDKEYILMRTSIDAIRDLRDETVEATEKLRKAHGKLAAIISTKKTLRSTIVEVQDLYSEVKKIKIHIALLQKLKQ